MSKPSSKRSQKPEPVLEVPGNGNRPTIIEHPAQTVSRELIQRFAAECVRAGVPMVFVAPLLVGSRGAPSLVVSGAKDERGAAHYLSLASCETTRALCNIIAGAPGVTD